MPDEMKTEVDDRRDSTTPRSRWVQEAILVRFALEDEGLWSEYAPEDIGERLGAVADV